MKKLLLYSLVAFLSLPGFAQKPLGSDFTINGKINGMETGYIYLSYQVGEAMQMDSAAITKGSFVFKGKLSEPVMVSIAAARNIRSIEDPNITSVFIEPAVMDMSVSYGTFKQLTLKGSNSNDELEELNRQKAPILKEMEPAQAAYRSEKDYSKKPALYEKLGPFKARMNKVDLAYISAHPDSYVSAYLMKSKMNLLKLDEVKALYHSFTPRIKASEDGKYVYKEMLELESGSPGSLARVFSTIDINGEKLDLADFKGKKYVLIDFWASWCLPCRKGNPHLLSLYSKYKDKGLEIIGMAYDDGNSIGWKKAVEEDKIGVWKHVLRGLKISARSVDATNDLSKGYGVHVLPTKILIDKNGIIIGRYGGGGEDDEALDKKLAEIFVNIP
ncbi:AhpC/TSA family protein [Pedobacter montanisoli]|uniref:AhpC/TSA family protein n=1 Tax=Pedobacter montanisoli TaxID=2923277 RepID=A0ABS9ZUF7_9SPHI|nr:AhpC/TSA family protein [Pedobacter montanisoli]MCJ0741188.1 AhpC/TSA family protein [Pedobacter montanisoli]